MNDRRSARRSTTARNGLTSLAMAVVFSVMFPSPSMALPLDSGDSTGSSAISTILAQLHVAVPNSAGYDRTLFQHWTDRDGNGCDTRQEVLIRQSLVPAEMAAGCSVVAGQWYSRYDGATWTDPADVDIDHMVPLNEAWKSGANSWTSEQRSRYANDLDLDVALQAVTDSVNQSKGDRDPAEWMPPLDGADCQYASDWVLVKYRWNLAVDSVERSTLGQILSGDCGATLVPIPAIAQVATVSEQFDRISGADRYATAVSISEKYDAGVPVLYIATGSNYPDALSAAPAAAAQGGPLLLTTPALLPNNVRAEIVRLSPSLIVVVGGESAVSPDVYRQLGALAPAIRRDSGADRYETSRTISQRAFPSGASSAFVATGTNFPDALSAAGAAASNGSPVILLNGSSREVDTFTRAFLVGLGVTRVTIAGGPAVVSPEIEAALRVEFAVNRLAGGDRFETSSAINRGSFFAAPTVYFAVGSGFADALAGAALAGRDNAALYVVPGTCVPDYVVADLQSLGTTKRILLGGAQALSDDVGNLRVCAIAPVVTPPPPTVPGNPGDSKNCGDFATWSAAQAWFNTYFPHYGDVARLDQDNDGIACESLPGHP